MEGVKRAKSVQKKLFITSCLSFSPTQMLFQLDELRTHCLGISLWLLPACSFGGIFIHRSCKIIRITRWHIPLRLYSDKSARGILEIRKQKGGNSS